MSHLQHTIKLTFLIQEDIKDREFQLHVHVWHIPLKLRKFFMK